MLHDVDEGVMTGDTVRAGSSFLRPALRPTRWACARLVHREGPLGISVGVVLGGLELRRLTGKR